eukprot:5576176-Alexandrium_andersonii.AAC.1
MRGSLRECTCVARAKGSRCNLHQTDTVKVIMYSCYRPFPVSQRGGAGKSISPYAKPQAGVHEWSDA